MYFELLIWHAEKYDACNILTGLLCYLPSDVPLIGKQKLKKCTKFGSLTLLYADYVPPQKELASTFLDI